MSDKPILHLNLTKKWYDMIDSGEKVEEYRRICEHWNRVFSSNIKIKGKYYHPTDVVVCFSNGYRKDRRQMYWSISALRQRTGDPIIGAVEGEQYHVLVLGNKL